MLMRWTFSLQSILCCFIHISLQKTSPFLRLGSSPRQKPSEGHSATIFIGTHRQCDRSIKCTKFKLCLLCQSDSYPLKAVRRFTQVFRLLHYCSPFWWCSHFLAASCTCYYRVGRGTTQVAEWEKLISPISQLVVL